MPSYSAGRGLPRWHAKKLSKSVAFVIGNAEGVFPDENADGFLLASAKIGSCICELHVLVEMTPQGLVRPSRIGASLRIWRVPPTKVRRGDLSGQDLASRLLMSLRFGVCF